MTITCNLRCRRHRIFSVRLIRKKTEHGRTVFEATVFSCYGLLLKIIHNSSYSESTVLLLEAEILNKHALASACCCLFWWNQGVFLPPVEIPSSIVSLSIEASEVGHIEKPKNKKHQKMAETTNFSIGCLQCMRIFRQQFFHCFSSFG